jgi:aerobic carbon-monoxide dehydrogenase small subunit
LIYKDLCFDIEKIMAKVNITLYINGDTYPVAVEPSRTLAEVLREDLNLIGTKIGCETGDCGACTVLINGKSVTSCLSLAVESDGKEITTIEGLSTKGNTLHPIQEAFVEQGAIQCGYCTPGMILSAKYLLDQNPEPTETEIRQALSGNLCRCTGYNRIVKAVMAAGKKIKLESEESI